MTKTIRWDTATLAAYERRKTERRSKYGNTRVEQNGQKFDSGKEARRWLVLKQMESQGLISDLRRQVAFELAPAVRLEGEKRKKPALRYIADAVYTQDGKVIVEDVKSAITRANPLYRAKKHLLKTVHGLDIKEI